MKFQTVKSSLKVNKWYEGQITKAQIKGEKLIIGVTFDKEPLEEYVKIIQIAAGGENESQVSGNSEISAFAEQMGIMDEDGGFETRDFKELWIKAKLKEGSNGRRYVNYIKLDESVYADEEMETEDE